MPRASSLISRTTTCGARSAPAFDAMSDSTARRAPSGPTLYPRLSAVRRAALWRMPPRSPCSNERADTRQESLPISDGTSSRCGRRQCKRPLGESGGTTQSISIAFWSSLARMTRVHPTPAPGPRPPEASRRVRAIRLPFFDPARHRVARHSEGAGEPAQTAALVIGAKYLFALCFRVSVAARLLPTALPTIAAEVALATVGNHAVTY